jgi:hypothetical protein
MIKVNTDKRERGPINSHEVHQQWEWWMERAQDAVMHDARYLANRQKLNLQENNLGIKFFVCLHGDKIYNSFVCGNTT